MGLIKDLLLDFCVNKALKYDMKIQMLINLCAGSRYEYAIKILKFLRKEWLNRVEKLSDNNF